MACRDCRPFWSPVLNNLSQLGGLFHVWILEAKGLLTAGFLLPERDWARLERGFCCWLQSAQAVEGEQGGGP